MIECRNISKGKAEGELIVSNEAISFLGGVDPETGVVIDPNHELKGQSIKDKVLFIPGGNLIIIVIVIKLIFIIIFWVYNP